MSNRLVVVKVLRPLLSIIGLQVSSGILYMYDV